MKTNVVNVKKVTAVVIAFLMMILSVVYSNNKSDAANTTQRYMVYNAQTGQYLRRYSLNALKSEDNSRFVIGKDDREIDWSKSGVVKIINYHDGYYNMGSGFVVSDHIIATAAHCIYNQAISEVLLFDNNGNVTMHATPVEYHIPVDYINENAEEYHGPSDYALITVKEDLSAYACFDLGVPLDSFTHSNSAITLMGFPGQFGEPGKEVWVNTNTEHNMCSAKGQIHYDASYDADMYISYTADESGGDSGGPVYITESAHDETYYTVVGINIGGPSITNPNFNVGTRMTTNLIHFYGGNNTNIRW